MSPLSAPAGAARDSFPVPNRPGHRGSQDCRATRRSSKREPLILPSIYTGAPNTEPPHAPPWRVVLRGPQDFTFWVSTGEHPLSSCPSAWVVSCVRWMGHGSRPARPEAQEAAGPSYLPRPLGIRALPCSLGPWGKWGVGRGPAQSHRSHQGRGFTQSLEPDVLCPGVRRGRCSRILISPPETKMVATAQAGNVPHICCAGW